MTRDKGARQLKSVLFLQRSFLRGSIIEYAAVLLFFLVVTIFYTDGVLLNLFTRVFTMYPGDGTGGFMWYSFAQPGLDPFLRHTDLVNYPFGEAIGGPTFITYFGLWLPLRLLSFLFGPIGGVNMFMALAYVLSAVSMYWLIKRLTGSAAVALFAGFAVAYNPYALQKSVDHMPYILSYVFIFMLASFIGLWKRPVWQRGVLFGVTIALAFYTDGYYVLLGSVFVVSLLIGGIAHGLLMKMHPRQYMQRAKALVMALLTMLVLLSPILAVQLFNGSEVNRSLEGRRSNIAQEFQIYRSNVIDFLLPARDNPFFKDDPTYKIMQYERNSRSNATEATTYIGYTLMFLSVLGVSLLISWLVYRKKSSFRLLSSQSKNSVVLVACIVAVAVPLILSFMFSPAVYVKGFTIPLPGQLFIDLGISLWRVLSRFFVPLHVLVVLFASVSLWLTIAVIAARKKTKPVMVKSATWVAVVVCMAALAVEYATVANRPTFDFSKVNPGYVWLRNQDDIHAVVELPVVDPLDQHTADYVTYQIVHGKKLLNFKETTTDRSTNVLGDERNTETIDWAYKRGAQAVIIHTAQCSQVEWGSLVYESKVNDDGMCIYKLDKPVTNDGVFLEFKAGIVRRQNLKDQQNIVVDESPVLFKATDHSFTDEGAEGSVAVEMRIESLQDNLQGGSWRLEATGGELIAEGVVGRAGDTISAVIDGRSQLRLVLTNKDNTKVAPFQYQLVDIKATRR